MYPEMTIHIDPEKCDGCGLCVTDCLRRALGVQNGRAVVLYEDCLKCGHCVAVCPANAARIDGVDDPILEKTASAGVVDAASLYAHLKLRRSVRHYQNIPVEREKLARVIEAGRLTPTGGNRQHVRYIVLQSGLDEWEDEIIAQVREEHRAAGNPPPPLARGYLFHGAPVALLAVSESQTDACLAAMSMELMAEALGLGTLYVGLFTRPANQNAKVRQGLGLAENENIAICLALGYPAVRYLRSAPKKPARVDWR